MDIGNLFLGKAIYDDATRMDKIIQKGIDEDNKLREDIELIRSERMKRQRALNKQSQAYEEKIDIIQDENNKLYAELEVMRQVVKKKNEALQNAKNNLESFNKLAIVLNEQALKEKKEKEILKNMLLNGSFLDLAEVNDTIKGEIASERAFLHNWILSRNSFWEMAYRFAQEHGIEITMDELKAKADSLKEEVMKNGFSAPDYKNSVNELEELIKPEVHKEIIDNEIKDNDEVKRLKGELSLEQQLALVEIDTKMNLLNQGIDPDLPIKELIKP
jgi:DNA repair exonuclease SbcCD ATPase subunit